MIRCRICALKTEIGTNNMKIHITRKHPGAILQQDAEPVVVTHMLADELETQHREEEETEPVPPEQSRCTRAEIEEQLHIHIDEHALAEIDITVANISKAFTEHNTHVLSTILTLAAGTQ